MLKSLHTSTADYFLQLTLPPAFGSAYVGEVFACTLCVNNELPRDGDRTVTSVNIVAEMQTPSSQTTPLELDLANSDAARVGLEPGTSIQKIVRFDLQEEGNHVLVVSLSYSENIVPKLQNSASSGRIRTFRKLYQFIARPCLSVRTKTTDLQPLETEDETSQKVMLSRYALEAQLENLTDGLLTLESLDFNANPPFQSSSLNWDVPQPTQGFIEPPTLACREVTQVAFLIAEQSVLGGTEEIPKKELTKDGRTILGMLTIHWRSAMGDPGVLSTGWLTSKRK